MTYANKNSKDIQQLESSFNIKNHQHIKAYLDTRFYDLDSIYNMHEAYYIITPVSEIYHMIQGADEKKYPIFEKIFESI